MSELTLPILGTVLLVVFIFMILFLVVLLIVCFAIIATLFKRYDSLYKEYEQFIEETTMYSDIESVEDAARDLHEHCDIMRNAIDHNEEILFINFKNHIERFLFQLGTLKQFNEVEG